MSLDTVFCLLPLVSLGCPDWDRTFRTNTSWSEKECTTRITAIPRVACTDNMPGGTATFDDHWLCSVRIPNPHSRCSKITQIIIIRCGTSVSTQIIHTYVVSTQRSPRKIVSMFYVYLCKSVHQRSACIPLEFGPGVQETMRNATFPSHT
jgi:hypothetical protein